MTETMTTTVPAYESLLYTVFQKLRQSTAEADTKGKGLAVAFTSANSGEGVTHTIQALLSGLARDGASRTLFADSRILRNLTIEPEEIDQLFLNLPGSHDGALTTIAEATNLEGPHSWEGSWEYRRQIVRHLQSLFDYVLIDCPSLRESNDILSVAPFVNGVILVVEAGRTRRDQILHAQKSIEFARGKLIGQVLNKRSYAIPDWIYRRL